MNVAHTRERLLDAAESLFAKNGINATSLRAITAAAEANLASVHYHFGSKDALTQAVFARRLDPLNRERLRLLNSLEAAELTPPPLESIIEAFVAPALSMRQDPSRGGGDFCLLMGRIYSEPAELRLSILEHFDEVSRRFTAVLSRVLPDLPKPELLWKFFFMIGSMVMTLVGADIIAQRSGGICDPTDVQGVLRRLVAYIAAGMRASIPENAGGKP